MKINKDITFVYSDKAEYNSFRLIADEAEKRGYSVKFTENKFEKCEIGFYCQHVNFPQFSKFSVIMLHDIIQQYSFWPDLWWREPWDKYDIGILPSKQWEDNWNQCSQWSYTRPRLGMFKVGWPKADVIAKMKSATSKVFFFEKHNLDQSKRTVVYAPAWENDNKQDDFVKAMLPLNVNILIKQAHWADSYPQIIKNIKEMYHLHKDMPGVTILPPETNIFEAIAVSDILVSEESSTMCEAAMMGIPAVSVSDWLIPDVTPSRYPQCDYDFVIMTMRDQLSGCIKDILDNYEKYHEQARAFSEKTFSNIGKTCSMIMDIIDDVLDGKEYRVRPLVANKYERLGFSKEMSRRYYQFKRQFEANYGKRNALAHCLFKLAHRIHHIAD